jgi:hypothetical protein
MPQRLLPVLTFSLIALVSLFAPVSRARADAGEAHMHLTVDGYSAELVLPSGPAVVGPNLVLIRLHDTAGQPLDRATVLIAPVAAHPVNASTHNHGESGHDSATHSEAAGHTHTHGDSHIETIMTQLEAGTDAGNYTGVIHFDSAGAWQVQLKFNNAGVDHAGIFAVTIAEPARDWRILGAFGGVNGLIIVIAGVLKRRFPATAKHMPVATTSETKN